MTQRALAVIPARGGSKRLPRKNVLPFRGRPMLAWSVKAALETGRFDRVVVSTDDAEIASAGREAGADIEGRGAGLSEDSATVVQVCLDLLDREAEAGREYDILCVLYATAPLRTASDVMAVLDLLDPGRYDYGMAVTHYDLPPHQALRLGNKADLSPMWPAVVHARGSEIGELVVDNGSTYAVSVEAFRSAPRFYGPALRGHVMPRNRSVDLDHPEDLALLNFYADGLLGSM